MKMGFLREIKDVVVSLAKGLKITLRYWVDPSSTITVQFPEEKRQLAERVRGILFNDVVRCTACGACVIACPVKCITVKAVGKGKARKPESFIIEINKCMFCGLCVDACPTGSLTHTQELTMARYSLDELVIEYVTDELREKFRKEAEEYEHQQAQKAVQKAEEKKKDSGTEKKGENQAQKKEEAEK